MPSVKIISDSSCDLTDSLFEQYDIAAVPYLVSFDGEKYFREDIDITNDDFYKKMRAEEVFPKTSLPTIDVYTEMFRKYTAAGLDIVCLCLTAKFSGSYNSAVTAAALVNDEYGKERVFVVDTIQATCAQGAIVLEAAKMKDAGYSAEEIFGTIERLKHTCVMYVTVDSLVYLQRGGRVGKANALAGTLLNIKPVIVLREGELLPLVRVRGRKKSLLEVAARCHKDVKDSMDAYEFYLAQADVLDEANEFIAMCEADYGIKLSYPAMDVGITIGAHIGPTAVGLGYIKKFSNCL